VSPRRAQFVEALRASGLSARVQERPDATGTGSVAVVTLELGALDAAERARAVAQVQAIAARFGVRHVLRDAAEVRPERAPSAVCEARAVLGLGPGHGERDVVLAWRRLARQTHPDAGGSHDAFVRAQRAVEILRAHMAGRGECAA
jgi:hypothetical protein